MAIVTQNQIGVFPVGGGVSQPELVDTQFLTTTSNWDGATAIAAGATSVSIILVGGGGGGGSAEVGSSGSFRDGGYGGEAGVVLYIKCIPISELSLTETFTSGPGGAGAAGSASSGDGAAGSSGQNSIFFKYKSKGGNAGAESNLSGPAPSYTIPGNFSKENLDCVVLYSSSQNISDNITFITFTGPAIGGDGGRISSSNIASPGSNSIFDVSFLSSPPVTSVGGSASVGENGKVAGSYYATGGAGGGSNNAGTLAFSGGDGLHGSGGGGGSASTTGNLSGAGGNGGNGILAVFAYK